MTDVNPEELSAYKGDDEVVHWTEFLLQKADQTTKAVRFDSGFKVFNEKLAGLQTGQVIAISGKKKNGKTLFAESWIRSIQKVNPSAKAVIFSFEVQTEKLLIKYMQENAEPQIYVPKTLKSADFEWLVERCLEAKLKFGAQIVLIDHLHFMVDMNTKLNMSLNIGAFMRRLKHDVALGLNMAVLLIAHQRGLEKGEEVSGDSMRDSTFIGQESDATILVSRRKNFTSEDLNKLSRKYSDKFFLIEELRQHVDSEDPYSSFLATVKIDCCRETGVFDFKRTFRKIGNFLEEI